jgi:hypothetical protein
MAKEVWKRRTRIDLTVSVVDENVSSSSTRATTSAATAAGQQILTTRRIKRRQRQVRMFKVILTLMVLFCVCRMPAWIFLLYKLGVEKETSIHWLLSNIFGLGILMNCMLNPFLYTFLSETIRLTTFLGGIMAGIFTAVFRCSRKSRKSNCDDTKQQYFDRM